MGAATEGSGARRLLFLGVGLILLAGAGGVICAWLGRQTEPLSPGLTGGGDTAHQALVSAAELATQWQEDARLAYVSGQWLGVGTQSGEEIEWAFQFFSSSTQHLALVVVSDGTAHVVHDSLSPYSVQTFSAEDWRIDSDQARQMWWNQGGGSMVAQRPDVDLLMQLCMQGEENARPVWTVAGLIAGTENVFTVMVDATNGALVGP